MHEPMTEMEKEQVRGNGRVAYGKGESQSANPHNYETEAGDVWAAGWKEAKELNLA